MSSRARRSGANKKRPLLVLTPGDPDGIGPEITWKALQALWRRRGRTTQPPPQILCVGARGPFERLGAPIEMAAFDENGQLCASSRGARPHIWLLEAPTRPPKGKLLPGYQAGWSIQRAVELLQAGQAQALVTGPIHKGRLQKGGFAYDGHTDFLADLCRVKSVTMMLANASLRSSLVTVHTSLGSVPQKVTAAHLERAIRQTAEGLQTLWKIRRPRIGVAALNPHAGEGGLFGTEEKRVLIPTIEKLRRDPSLGAVVEGPFPADTLFARHVASLHRPTAPVKPFDAIVSMYHDQGLIPVKLLDFGGTVNLTLGLPIIRTSVDHGTAFDIAGKNLADPSSLMAAIALAWEFTGHRPLTQTQKKNRS